MLVFTIQVTFLLLLGLLIGVFVGWLLKGFAVNSRKREAALAAERLERSLADTRKALNDCEGKLRTKHVKAHAQTVHAEQPASTPLPQEIAEELPEQIVEPPKFLDAPQGKPDDLKQIRGVGKKLEKTLNGLGIYHFHQVAAFTPQHVAWVDEHLRFRGRIEREGWIEQARILAAGGDTEFSTRYQRD